MAEAVIRKRPAQIVAPPPGTITGPLPPTPAAPGRHPFRAPHPRPRPKEAPRPTRGRRSWPIGLIVLGLLFLGLFVLAMGIGAATSINLPGIFERKSADEPPPKSFPVLDPSRPERLTIPSIKVEAAIKESLRRTTDEAVADGVFGAPGFVVDDGKTRRLFWGQDRMHLVAAALGGPPETVDFWFDFSSPYAYLGSTQIERVVERHGAVVRWRPFLLGALF